MKISNFSKISTNIFGSRVTGFIRDILFANYLGANLMSDAFLFAFRLPNLFRRIFAEGSMNSVFIPLFVNQEKINSKIANDFIWIIFNFFFGITLFLSFLIFLFSEQVISLLAPGFLLNESQFLFVNDLLIITFPFLIFVTLSSVLSSVLNVKGKFFLPSFLSVILNIFMIVSLIIFKSESHFALAWSMIVAGFTQLILLFINGETPIDRLSNPISIEDKTDLGNVKKFSPKDIFDASDFIIERLATMFDNERKLQKSL